MSLFTDEIDNRIKELQELDEYKGKRKGWVSNKKIADTINAEFGTNYSAEQIYHRRENLNPSGRERKKKYAQSDKGKDRIKDHNSKIAIKIYNTLVCLARTKYGREVLGLNQKETMAYLKENQLSIDHIAPIERDYIEQLCMVNGYRWHYWSDVPKHIQEKLNNMFNQIENLQLIPMSENLAKRDMTKRTKHY